MRLGLLTACLPGWDLPRVAAYASDAGFQALEVAAWPAGDRHPHHATHLDVAAFRPGDAPRLRALLTRWSLTVPVVTYCGNNLHPDPVARQRVHHHLRACVDAAAALGVPYVETFVGRDTTRTVAEDIARAPDVLLPLLGHAADRGVRLLVENCPMPAWHPDGSPANLAYSPELWDWLYDLGGPGQGFRLAFDPSHLPPLGIDPIEALRYALRLGMVAHVQAKDVDIDPDRRAHYGVHGPTVHRRSPDDVRWWRYRAPGLGLLDWHGLVDVLRGAGFHGTVAVEYEDPVCGDGPAATERGLATAVRTLRPLLSAGP